MAHVFERRTVRRMKTVRLTPTEFAEHFGLKRSRVYQWLRRGQIEAVAYGPLQHPTYLIDPSEIERVRHLLKS